MDFGSQTAVRDLSFDVNAGETFGFLGSNGCGKTTTLRALLRIQVPGTLDGGDVLRVGKRVFVGISAGATIAAALRIAETAPAESVLLAMLPDTGERYLSTFLFEGVNEGSDDAWLAELEERDVAA